MCAYSALVGLGRLRRYKRLQRECAFIGACGVTFLLLIASGAIDFARETDFSHFQWPPYTENIRELVREKFRHFERVLQAIFKVINELINGTLPQNICNDWRQIKNLVQPTCKHNSLTRRKSLLIVIKTAPSRVEVSEEF